MRYAYARYMKSFFLYEHKHIERFSNLHQCTFDIETLSKLKVKSCKSYSNKYMIALTPITSTEVFVFIDGLAFKLLSRKVLFIKKKTI